MGGRILIGVTGSVATIKLQQLVDAIRACSRDVELKIVATDYALSFIPEGFPEEILTDKSEWTMWSKRGDPILHIEVKPYTSCTLLFI